MIDEHRLHERVLAFMGAYAQLQFHIDNALEQYLRKQMPELGPLIAKNYISRIPDDHRMHALLALAKEVDYSRDLDAAKAVYSRAKDVRDYVSHSLGVTLVWNPKELAWLVSVTHLGRNRRKGVPRRLVPETFDQLRNDCEWLSQHALRVTWESGVPFFGEPPDPPEVPEDHRS